MRGAQCQQWAGGEAGLGVWGGGQLPHGMASSAAEACTARLLLVSCFLNHLWILKIASDEKPTFCAKSSVRLGTAWVNSPSVLLPMLVL